MNSKQSFGETIRTLRKERDEPLRVVAAALGIDSTLLSKIERGERLPTETQRIRFAKYFDLPLDQVTAQVIADKIVTQYGHQATMLQAMKIVKERATAYAKDHK